MKSYGFAYTYKTWWSRYRSWNFFKIYTKLKL